MFHVFRGNGGVTFSKCAVNTTEEETRVCYTCTILRSVAAKGWPWLAAAANHFSASRLSTGSPRIVPGAEGAAQSQKLTTDSRERALPTWCRDFTSMFVCFAWCMRNTRTDHGGA